MKIGVPKEIKNREFRVGLTPAAVRELTARGHEVSVETGAGAAIGFPDEAYEAAGARILAAPGEVFARADLVVKVKEPQPGEVALLREGQILFTYLHLAPDPAQTRGLLASGCTAVAYETVTDPAGRLPLLAPMSEVAGRLSVQAGARSLEMAQGGRGVLLGGVPGVEPARVVVIGGGVVGTNAARVAAGMGADVTVLDRSVERLHQLDDLFAGRVRTLYSTAEAIERLVTAADLVIGAVLVPGAAAPKLVSRDLVAAMPRGSVLVDVAIDQGGCFATSRPTTHDDPTYVVDGVVHYCVANMPGAVARTSTLALVQSTLPYVLALADNGLGALRGDPGFRNGLNVHRGRVTHPAVAEAHGLEYVPPEVALAS
ncbi:MAG: alanine dehydrogenase [Candidatus Dadabacteria bacterium]|nr:MAG: alanine dehydrogenase [Candidatus Dadabacteria bacterium]